MAPTHFGHWRGTTNKNGLKTLNKICNVLKYEEWFSFMTERMFHHSWVSFYCPAILFICVCACLSPSYLLKALWAQADDHLLNVPHTTLRALMLKPKRRENMSEECISLQTVQLCVLYWCMLTFTLSCLLMIILPKQYLYCERTKSICLQGHCVLADTGGGTIRIRQRAKQTVFVPGERNWADTSIALLLSRVDHDTSVYNQLKQQHTEGILK